MSTKGNHIDKVFKPEHERNVGPAKPAHLDVVHKKPEPEPEPVQEEEPEVDNFHVDPDLDEGDEGHGGDDDE